MLLRADENGARQTLCSATAMPRASGFLWNRQMMLHVNCRGYVKAQHMQPEAGKYSYAPNMEERSFIQPEQPYYAHHPGRFVYIKDENSGQVISVPHEPVRQVSDRFEFSVGQCDIQWRLESMGLEVELSVSLPAEDVVELWTLKIRNSGTRERKLSVYPFFSIGYMSWMNQSASYQPELGAIIATCVTPYQKSEDADFISSLKDKTFLLHGNEPDAWETSLEAFEGEGGLHQPTAIGQDLLGKSEAVYETPVAALQYRIDLAAGNEKEFRFAFGPARTESDIALIRDKYLGSGGFEVALSDYQSYMQAGRGCLQIETPDADLDNFVNKWLGRQLFYHGDVNRMTTDPQTRNYLQDAMGMAYIRQSASRAAFLHALSQQESTGAMPDGILLHEGAQLKYINQIPHSDHCVWLPVCLQAYLDETGDYGLLDEVVVSGSEGTKINVFERITMAMQWLTDDRDHRDLNYIAQGDWCDPMNMVGHKGKGVSGWLSIATVYALKCWADIARQVGRPAVAAKMLKSAEEMKTAIQKHLWDGDWFARGITDDNVTFGVSADQEGRIFLNPQSWAMLAGIASEQQTACMIASIEEQLEGPHGVAVLAPAYTEMREDIGRLTQKHPGVTENGSVYNHAAAFYIYALFDQARTTSSEIVSQRADKERIDLAGVDQTQTEQECSAQGYAERAYRLLRQMIPGPSDEDYLQRGQMPVFIPNHYRGDWQRSPRTAGRSSQLFNTGTISWVYRILVEGLFGVKGCREGLQIDPQLPEAWQEASITRDFRGARFNIQMQRQAPGGPRYLRVNGQPLQEMLIREFEPGQSYEVKVLL